MQESYFYRDQDLAWQELGNGVKRKIMAYDDQLMIVKVEFAQDAVGSAHQHVHSQLSYVASGKFEVHISGESSVLSQGDVFRVPSNAIHGVKCLEAGVLIDAFSPMRADFL